MAWGVGSGFDGGTPTGYVFYARVFCRAFMRFVLEDSEAHIKLDTLTCLGILSSSEESERMFPDAVPEGAFDAWGRTRRDNYEEWTWATGSATLHRSVRPSFGLRPTTSACTGWPDCRLRSGTASPTLSKQPGASGTSGGSARCSFRTR